MKNSIKLLGILTLLFNFQFANSQVDIIYNDLVWSDEFDSGSKPNPDHWSYEVGFVSAAHTSVELDKAKQAIFEALDIVFAK